MQKALLQKAGLIGLVLLILQGLLMTIGSVIGERKARQDGVVREIASSHYGPQVFTGPILSLPYTEEFEETVTAEGVKKTETRRIERSLRFFPATSEIQGEATASTKSRGLFKARIFDWNATLKGEFVLAQQNIERSRTQSRIVWGQPILSIVLNDPRGLIGTPSIKWGEEALAVEKGSGLPYLGNGLHARVAKIDLAGPQRFVYAMKIGLRGTESLSIVPLANTNHISIDSTWPHPSFGGQFLPDPQSQQVSGNGFKAQWKISALASKAQQQLLSQLDRSQNCGDASCAERISIRFIEPIDIYALSDRAIKYGLLFIVLTFGCFILFEILKRLPIHPAQYLLVGIAMAIFFLLLIALSEHIAFAIAYLLASGASIALLGIYLSAVLRSRWRGLAFGGLLTMLYSALYGLLVSEDNALLLGSLLLFGLIALAMIATRHVDWYAINTDGA